MRRAVLAVLCFAALFSSCSPSYSGAAGCKAIETVVSGATASGHKVTMLTGAPVARAVGVYNSFPPTSNVEASTAVLIDLAKGGGMIALGSGVDLCVVAYVKGDGWASVREVILTGKKPAIGTSL